MYKNYKIFFIAYFAPITQQAEDLARLFSKEGAKVFISSRRQNVILRALDFGWSLIKYRSQYDTVIIQSHSYLNFLYTPYTLILSKILRKRFIIMYLGGGASDFFPRYKNLIKPVFRFADEIIVGSGYLKNEFNNIQIKAKEIPAVINLKDWRFKKRNNFKPNILWLRGLFPEYNPNMAVSVIKHLKMNDIQANLTFVGNPFLKREVVKFSKKLDVSNQIKILGHVNPENLQKVYDDHDIFINTTHVDNQPRSVIEAMACGLPVISTNVGGIPYLIKENSNGLLVDDDDSEHMASCIIKILNDLSNTKKIVNSALLGLEIYNWRNVKEQWAKII